MPIVCVDWRQADGDHLAALYRAEIDRWATLGWDTASSWDQIELGRRLGTVSGLCALDAVGAIAGWTFFLRHRDVLQVGGFLAASEDATAALLEGILASDAAARARSVTCFAFTDAPGLTDALAHRGLTVVRYDYLSKPLVAEPHTRSLDVRPWRADDAIAGAKLLASAYPMPDEGRPFAPRGTAEEWQEYVGQIVNASGCGTIMPDACFVVRNGPDRIAAMILVTRLAATTAHVAQIAVEPGTERRGVGRLLMDAACANAREAGCTRMTLLVDGRNVRARRLYAHAGFVAVAGFVSAGSVRQVARQPAT